MMRAGQKPEVLDFVSGQTESWLNPPPGDYTLKLELVSNVPGDNVEASAIPVTVSVKGR